MAIRVDADGVIEILTEVETNLESEDSKYDYLDSEDSICSREYDDEPINNEDDNTDDKSEENLDESEEESEESTTTGGRAAGRRRQRSRYDER